MAFVGRECNASSTLRLIWLASRETRAPQKETVKLFLTRESTLRFPLQMPAKTIINAPKARKQHSFHSPGGFVKPDCWRLRELLQFQLLCKTCLGLQAGPPCRLFVGSASKPGSESIRRVSVWSSSKNQTRDLSGGFEAYKLEVKASHMLWRGLHPTLSYAAVSETPLEIVALKSSSTQKLGTRTASGALVLDSTRWWLWSRPTVC